MGLAQPCPWLPEVPRGFWDGPNGAFQLVSKSILERPMLPLPSHPDLVLLAWFLCVHEVMF